MATALKLKRGAAATTAPKADPEEVRDFIWHASLGEEGFGEARRVAQAHDEDLVRVLDLLDNVRILAGAKRKYFYRRREYGYPLPGTPAGDLKLYFDDANLDDLLIAVTWSG